MRGEGVAEMPWLALHRSTVLAEARAHARPLTFVRVRVGQTTTEKATTALATLSPTPSTAKLNWPNAITLAGYAATLAWLAGGPWWLAVAGIAADEVDGRVARATGETSEYGGLLDWAVDLTLTGLVLPRLGWTWMLLAVTP